MKIAPPRNEELVATLIEPNMICKIN